MNCKFPSPSCICWRFHAGNDFAILTSWLIVSLVYIVCPARRALEALMSFQLSVTLALLLCCAWMPPHHDITYTPHSSRPEFGNPFFESFSTRVAGFNLFALKSHKSGEQPPNIEHSSRMRQERKRALFRCVASISISQIR